MNLDLRAEHRLPIQVQAGYVLGYRTERPTGCALPPRPGPTPAEA